MAEIIAKKGLDIPILGKASGEIQTFDSEHFKTVTPLEKIALSVSDFHDIRFRLLKKEGESVAIGEPILEDKACEGKFFCAPAAGKIAQVRRGLKRRLLDIVISLDKEETFFPLDACNLSSSQESIINFLKKSGLFVRFKQRPFDCWANPNKKPRNIFVKAVDTAPFSTPYELQVKGYEKEFQFGLDLLGKLTSGSVHLTVAANSSCSAFTKAQNVNIHNVSGPHPAGNLSLAINQLDPITHYDQTVWTLDAYDVLCVGFAAMHQKMYTRKVIAVCGPGVQEDKRRFYEARQGFPVHTLISGRQETGLQRYISGDVLTGSQVSGHDFMGFFDYTLTVLPENKDRELLHFFRPGFSKFTASKTYASGWLPKGSSYLFNTNQHGEKRGFIDGAVYDRVMPLPVPTMMLVKAVLMEDFDMAENLGLLEVASEDFSLPTFVCPSKIEMCEIIQEGLEKYAQEVLS